MLPTDLVEALTIPCSDDAPAAPSSPVLAALFTFGLLGALVLIFAGVWS